MIDHALKARELLERSAAILGSQGMAAWDALAAEITEHLAAVPEMPAPTVDAKLETADQLRAACRLMQAGWEDANRQLEHQRKLNARLQYQLDSQSGAPAVVEAAQSAAEPWQHIAAVDLDSAEHFLVNSSYSFSLPRDDATLRNISLHCIREVRASRIEIARLKDALEARLDRWVPIQEERPGEDEGDLVCYTEKGYVVAMPCEGGVWRDNRAEAVSPTHFIRLTPPAGRSVTEPRAGLPAERSVTIEKDIFGTVHVKMGEFDFVQVQYQYPYTDNASQNRIAKRIQELLDPYTLTENERLQAERDQFRELARANARALGEALRERDAARLAAGSQ